MVVRLFFSFILTIFLYSCSKDQEAYKPSEKINPYEVYREGLEALFVSLNH